MKYNLLCIALFFSLIGFSQSVKFDGIVQDSIKKPLEMANVMAINSITKAMDSYGITNDKGKFSLNLSPNSTYLITISYIGFQSKNLTIVTQNENIVKTIELSSGDINLEGIEIVQEMPVSIKGDTIVYNADSFTSGTERKLEDVLKKLPGVTVNKDGEVEVEGKKVQKLMVDGKDFFDGDTKLGVKNIPADAIDKVQVLRNYNEIGALKGVENNQESVAMNIKLKKGKKNFWFGDVSAGVGVGHFEQRHIINPKLFYYSPKYSINIISNFNNIGELPLTIQDYFKFSGGFRSITQKGGSSLNVLSNDLGIGLLRNNRAKEIETRFGATNFSYSVTNKWTVSGFGIFSSSTTEQQTKTRSTILANGNRQNNAETSLQESNLGLFKLSSSYKPNAKLQFDYDILGKVSKQSDKTNLSREAIVNNFSLAENIFTSKNQDPTSITQNLSLYYTKNDKNIFALESQFQYQDEDPFFNANLQTKPFASILGYDILQNRTNLNQSRFVRTNKFDTKLDYYYLLTPKSNINITFGNTISNQNFDSSIFQILDNSQINNLVNSKNINKVNFKFNDAFIGLHYKVLSGKFTFTPGFSVHNYNTKNTQLGTEYVQNFNRILPDFFALYQLKRSETLTYNFAMTNDFTDINQLAEGNLLQGINSLFRGDKTLENAALQTHSLRYFKYNMFNFENIFATVNYTKRMNAIKTNAVFDGINQRSSPFNSNFADETFNASGSYGRSFRRYYKASLDFNFNWSRFNNIQNNIFAAVESISKNGTVKASTNFKNVPNIELAYNYNVRDYQGNRFITENPSVRLDYFFLKSFSFVSEYEYNHYYNPSKTVNNEFDFLSASIIYQKKGGKMEYKVSGTNLLNTTSLNDDNFSQFSTRTSQYVVQPRYVMFTMKYNL